MLIYDIEIVNAIQKKSEERISNIKYCNGWGDHANMGISVIGAYDYVQERYRTFCSDNLDGFKDLVKKRYPLVGFNNISFDNKVLAANGVDIPEHYCYDLLREIWKASGLGPHFDPDSHAGYGLDACIKANFPAYGKTSNGALAPIGWQKGKIGYVIDYCLADVWLTKMLLDRIVTTSRCISPVTGKTLFISPWRRE